MPMSLIEVVEQIVAAWNERDWEAAESLCDSEIVTDYSRRLVDPGVHQGHHAIRDLRPLLLERRADASIEVEDAVVIADKVVSLMRVRATGKASGAQVRARFADLWTIRAGLRSASSTSAIVTRPSPRRRAPGSEIQPRHATMTISARREQQ